MDYTSLRQQGIRHLERMAGGQWTDFNAHDPGITILEQLCYALTDLGYRIAHEIPDLLADGGRDPYESLYQAPEILTCHPVTLLDLRKLVLDVDGVRNAWIEADEERAVPLYYHPGRAEIGSEDESPASEPVTLEGLYRVLIETSDLAGTDSDAVRTKVARRLHAYRPLCEDFTEIRVLEPQAVQVRAEVEIGPVDDAGRVLLEILEGLADHVSPPIAFASPDQMLAAGTAVDHIFDGPRLTRGFLDPEALGRAERRTEINTADLIHVIMGVPGVRAIRRISVSAGGPAEAWSLKLDPAKAPKLDLRGSEIGLEKGGLTAGVDLESVLADYRERQRKRSEAPAGGPDALAPPAGRDRNVGKYHPVQHQFPALYGIGEMGLPDSAAPGRKAKAKQLEAYLTFFDQLLANYSAQLAHAGELFSFDGDSRETYFAQALEDPEEIRVHDAEAHRARLEEITESSNGARPSLERKNRFLSHLLARFAEDFTDYSLVLSGAMPAGGETRAEKLARDKQAFLQRYPRISSARGTAVDYLEPGSVSGLEERLRLELGLVAELGEDLVLVEHILLRPMAGDERQEVPLLAAASCRDPYSLQLSFVLPQEPERFANPGFKHFIERTIREETPAHLTPYVHWLGPDDWTAFQSAYQEWLERRRQYGSEKLGVTPEKAGV